MRFRARVEAWFEVDTLDEAQAAADIMESAAFDALGPIVIPEPEHGGLSRTELEPMDKDALAALAADDLGPGISSVRFESGSRDSSSS
jgi:hypothetical protein